MSKCHDENKDLIAISRVGKIDYANKLIQLSGSAVIGIRTWGRIDYLVNHCGYYVSRNNSTILVMSKSEQDNYSANTKIIKREYKSKLMTDRKRRNGSKL